MVRVNATSQPLQWVPIVPFQRKQSPHANAARPWIALISLPSSRRLPAILPTDFRIQKHAQ